MPRKSSGTKATSPKNDDAEPTPSNNARAGIMMILSPAKTLDLSPLAEALSLSLLPKMSKPDCCPEKRSEIAKVMKDRSESELIKLLSISKNLASTAKGYWDDYNDENSNNDLAKPCIYAFSGAAYQGLQINECSPEAVAYMQDNLRIIDPLYGSLRPLDVIQPYRLEMASKGVFPKDKKVKLEQYWATDVTQAIAKDLLKQKQQQQKDDDDSCVLLNLASDEYSAAIKPDLLPEHCKYIKIVFWEEGRVVAVHAKRARGLMVRYVSENKIMNLEDIKAFNEEGYAFVEKKSDETTFVFDRSKQSPKSKTAGASNKRTATTTTKTGTKSKKSKR